MLPVLIMKRTLRLTRSGMLQPWLGPALRGVVAYCFKSRLCRHPADERETHWRYCSGCPLMRGCPYGELFEPDPPEGANVFRGQDQAARPLVLSAGFPVDRQWKECREGKMSAGSEIALTATLIGMPAIAHATYLWEAIAAAGRDRGRGLDPDNTTFEVLPQPAWGEGSQWSVIDLPPHPDAAEGVARWVRLRLTSPLFLRQRDDDGKRRTASEPNFADLLRASLRILGNLFALYAEPLGADFAALKESSHSVESAAQRFRHFQQQKTSNRSQQTRQVHGVVGEAVFENVPGALLHWLTWGGLVHAGIDRVAGAGGWRVAWTDARDWSKAREQDWHSLS